MVSGSCHCGAVNITLNEDPRWLVDCNCSICRKLGTLWGHVPVAAVTMEAPPDATLAYSWGDRELAFHSCRTCGCTTHWSLVADQNADRMAVNFRLFPAAEQARFQTRRFDGADSWEFLD